MSFITVPQDIIDSVIDQLHDDFPTLRVCSLVSSSFIVPAQVYLFNRISIKTERQCQRLYDILKGNTHIASSIRHLSVEGSASARGANPSRGCITCTIVFPPLLQLLPRLQSFTLQDDIIAWNDYPGELTSSLLGLFQSPSLTSLSLSNLHNVPIDQLSRCKNLKSLSLIVCTLKDSGPGSGFGGDKAVHLQSLGGYSLPPSDDKHYLKSLTITNINPTIRQISDILSSPHSSLSLNRLHTFGFLPVSRDELAAAWSIMQNAAACLTKFETQLSFFDIYDSAPALFTLEPINIGLLPELQSLLLVLPRRSLENFGWLLRFFSNASATNNITTIELQIVHNLLERQFSLWADLDAIFSRPEYASLDEVKLIFTSDFDPIPYTITDLEVIMGRHCPVLWSNGVLTIEILL